MNYTDDDIMKLTISAGNRYKRAGSVVCGSYEDYKQELLLQVYHALKTYDASKGSLTTFIYNVVHNRAQQLITRANNSAHYGDVDHASLDAHYLDYEESLGESIAATQDGVETQVIDRQVLKVAAQHMRKETMLNYVYGYTDREIAKMLGVSHQLVDQKIHRDLDNLRSILDTGKTIKELRKEQTQNNNQVTQDIISYIMRKENCNKSCATKIYREKFA